ncbi:hypothetical protein, partial [Corallococcus sp. CA053C]|uniref:hypothetical protein n=1 Tax=Corallococcus sp. CA053C TaxID=2316732 RepID=UPI001F2E235E
MSPEPPTESHSTTEAAMSPEPSTESHSTTGDATPREAAWPVLLLLAVPRVEVPPGPGVGARRARWTG